MEGVRLPPSLGCSLPPPSSGPRASASRLPPPSLSAPPLLLPTSLPAPSFPLSSSPFPLSSSPPLLHLPAWGGGSAPAEGPRGSRGSGAPSRGEGGRGGRARRSLRGRGPRELPGLPARAVARGDSTRKDLVRFLEEVGEPGEHEDPVGQEPCRKTRVRAFVPGSGPPTLWGDPLVGRLQESTRS